MQICSHETLPVQAALIGIFDRHETKKQNLRPLKPSNCIWGHLFSRVDASNFRKYREIIIWPNWLFHLTDNSPDNFPGNFCISLQSFQQQGKLADHQGRPSMWKALNNYSPFCPKLWLHLRILIFTTAFHQIWLAKRSSINAGSYRLQTLLIKRSATQALFFL